MLYFFKINFRKIIFNHNYLLNLSFKMVNVNGGFNRKYVRKAKLIRDRKRARIRNKKRSIEYEENPNKPKTKKEIKKEKREEHILKAVGMTKDEIHNLLTYRKDRIRKNRRDKRSKRYIKNDKGKKEMEVEDEDEK